MKIGRGGLLSLVFTVVLLLVAGCTPQGDTVLPKISSFTSSSNSVTAAGSVTLTVAATDNVGVSKVEFYEGSSLLATKTSSPYTHTIAYTAAENGTHSYTVKVYDAAGNKTTSNPVSVVVNVDDQNPTITSFSSSSNTVTAVGSITLTAVVTDNVGVEKLEFYEGATLLGTATSSPYTQAIAFTAANNGTHTYTAKAYDAAGNTATSSLVTVTVNIPAPDNQNPVISSFTSTSTNVTTASSITLTAVATDNIGVTKLEFYEGATLLGTDTSSPYSQTIAYTSADNATHAYTAKAYDAAGNTATSSPVNVVVNIPALGGADLIVSEVGSSFYSNSTAWFEVYNPSASSIDLANYTLKSRSISTAGGSSSVSTFTIASLQVPAGGYAIIGGKASSAAINSPKAVYVLNAPSIVPFWNADGFVELLKGGQTVDFVRFGSSAQVPTTASAWSGANVPALPSSPNDYGKAIIRTSLSPASDTNSAADWSARDFATPGGPNDVPAGAVDADGDGIPDSAEVNGGTFAGINLFAMGATAAKRDIFIELDHMISNDPQVLPHKYSLDKVVAAFAAQNIAVHFDAGTEFSPNFDPANYNLGNSSYLLPFNKSLTLSPTAGFASLYELKAANMDLARVSIFHYMIYGSSQNAAGTCDSSGRAEIYGNDVIITFAGCGFNSASTLLMNYQANTTMHELGHNLGLRHGGFEDKNYKPNFISIMNYMYFPGIGPVTGTGAGDRYYLFRGTKGVTTTNLVNPPTSTSNIIDFSHGSSTDLDETNLDEHAGLGRGNADIDFDNSGTFVTGVAFDTNQDAAQNTLKDFDDWSNLALPFARSNLFLLGPRIQTLIRMSATPTSIVAPVSNDVQPLADETGMIFRANR